jgi:hypothetical protein
MSYLYLILVHIGFALWFYAGYCIGKANNKKDE